MANLAHLLVAAARSWPAQPAIAVGRAIRCDYAGLAGRASRIASGLRASGLLPGERVAIAARNSPSYVEALFAIWWAGAVAVPVNAKLHPKELAFVLANSGARLAFVDLPWHAALAAMRDEATAQADAIVLDGPDWRRLAEAPPPAAPAECADDDPAWLFYTSGTTGRPKGAVLSHGNLLAMARAFVTDVETIAPGDALLHPAPLSHGSGLYVVPHVMAGAVNVVPESGSFDPREIVDLVAAYDRALFFAAPTMLTRLLAAPEIARLDRGHLKAIVCGGGPLYLEDIRRAVAVLGPRLAQIYGQGESPMTITAMSAARLAEALATGDDARAASVGVAQTGIEVRIDGPGDPPLPIGEIGEVLVRGPTVMRGYWRDPGASVSALANGWLHTGDLGCMDAGGYLTLKDRSKDLIISGGANIYPREIEEVLLRHPAVAEVAVIGRAHPEWGEEVVACIVTRNRGDAQSQAALERELDALCLDHVARFKRPRACVFLRELPKNETGKVRKNELRRIAGEGRGGEGESA